MNWKSAVVAAEDGIAIAAAAAAAGGASLLRVREAGGPSRSAGSVKMGMCSAVVVVTAVVVLAAEMTAAGVLLEP